jgi:GWxTD domain-containing protein
MLRYMRYIVNRQEYAELTESKDPKASLDEIWLRFSPNKERAKQLIGIYFNRVQFSNRFFNSHLPGWKSDRGLIFIVFGYPSKILSDDASETWVYGEGNTIGSINFVFTKIENPFSDNDFALNRAEFYKELWQRTVDAWRQGRLLSER